MKNIVDLESISTPETQLWAAVMVLGIKDADDPEHAVKARSWIFDQFNNGVGSFNWICDILDLDCERIRSACWSRDGRKKMLRRHSFERFLDDFGVAKENATG